METITAQRRVSTALKHRTGLQPVPSYEFGDKVRIWREETERYEGPFIVHSYDNRKTVYVHIGNRIVSFSTSAVKIVHAEESSSTEDQNQIPADIISELEQIRAQYGDVPSTITNELAQNSNAFLSSEIAKSEIARFHKKRCVSRICNSCGT